MRMKAQFDSDNRSRASIYVDAAIFPFRGILMAHMFSLDLLALHHMAERLGIRRWFQDPSTMKVRWPHYDISSDLRDEAIRLGAIPVDRYQMLVMANHIARLPQQQVDFPPIVKALEWLEGELGEMAARQVR